jgi:hypothetical protein
MEWSGRTTLHKHKFSDWENYPVLNEDKKGFKKISFLDAQWSTCPIEVETQIKRLWRSFDLGNDHHIIKTSINELMEISDDSGFKTNAIIQYLVEQGITDNDELIIIHWWW